MPNHRAPRWNRAPERTLLLALYAEVDALVAHLGCECSGYSPRASAAPAEGRTPRADLTPHPACCHFAVTGREPLPTAVELQEVRYAMRAANVRPASVLGGRIPRRQLPVIGARRCPLLSEDGRCRIYASRPFGCRTFFCDAELPREAMRAIAHKIGALSEQFAPRDPGPRSLVRALASLGAAESV